MPIPGIIQPEIIRVDHELYLRRFEGDFGFALSWYQNIDTVWLVDGRKEPYTPELLEKMYRYLDEHGELYFIEFYDRDGGRLVGDVTFSKEDMPIVIGDVSLRGKKIGHRVISALIDRAGTLGFKELHVRDIYDWNTASRRCFESLGFTADGKTADGSSYKLVL